MSGIGSSVFWTVVVFVGGFIILGAVLFWARSHNRGTPREVQQTERATRDLYDGDPVDRREG